MMVKEAGGKMRLKILYVQAPGGGGSLLGLYEMLRQLDAKKIDPIVLCYYNNRFTRILETIPAVRVIYLTEALVSNGNESVVTLPGRFLKIILLQYYSLKKYFIS